MDWVLELRQKFDMPHTLADMGVTDERLDELSEMAAQDPTASGNPIPVGTAEMKEMFVAAIEGRLP
jgi:alcohol dehydrogenase class IV